MKILEFFGLTGEGSSNQAQADSVLRNATEREKSKELFPHAVGRCCGSCGGQKQEQK